MQLDPGLCPVGCCSWSRRVAAWNDAGAMQVGVLTSYPLFLLLLPGEALCGHREKYIPSGVVEGGQLCGQIVWCSPAVCYGIPE